MEKKILNIDEYASTNLSNELKCGSLESEDNIVLRFSDNVSCTPFGMLLMSNSIKKARNENSYKNFSISINKEAASICYAGHMGFFKRISEYINFGKLPGEAIGNNNYIPITRIDFINYRNNLLFKYMDYLSYIEYEAENLAKVLAQENEELKKLFTYLLREIIRNSQEHGKVDEAWICAQNWKNKNKAEIAILDNGIGYKNSLKEKYGKIVRNDEESIILALRPGITESYNNKYSQEDDNSGFGLYVASEFCDKLNGSFTIVSGEIMLKRNKGTIVTRKASHKGAIISMSIDTSIEFEYSKLLAEIVSKGEQITKSCKASELSKGKFLMQVK